VATQQSPRGDRVTVARILRPHGRRGEVAAEILTDFPERLTRLKSVELWNEKTAAEKRVSVRKCWLSHSRGGQAIFHFEISASISDAEKLVGLEVQIPLAERIPLPNASYYVTDLIGCEVCEKNSGVVGRVRDVQFTGEGAAKNPILVVDSARGELLIPLAQEICERVDVVARRIDVVLPEGLRDLN
jgi:16S rRNA processing protein RimM